MGQKKNIGKMIMKYSVGLSLLGLAAVLCEGNTMPVAT